MCTRQIYKLAFATAGAMTLNACGGGGGVAAMSSIPAPQVMPTPTTTAGAATVTIFSKPTPSTYASVGASAGLLGTTVASRYGAISSAALDPPQIRYSSSGYYEIQLPGQAWDTLVPYKGFRNPTSDNTSFEPASTAQGTAGFNTVPARLAGYNYSEYASWYSRDLARGGWVAFGSPTAADAVPVSGTATYNGTVHGTADIVLTDQLSAPATYPSAVDGKVMINFDFQNGKLAGGMDLYLQGYSIDPIKVGSFNFADTVYSVGSASYSGRFDTNVNGANFFLGQLTGPHAEETIGAWAIPFVFTQDSYQLPADNQVHQAIGAWVAKH